MAIHTLTLPVTNDQVKNLKVGDTVYLSGKIYTSRDMAHLEYKDILSRGEALPVDFQGAAIFHAGPVLRKEGDEWKMIVIGPTTSYRMEPYADMVGGMGVKLIIGKGGMRDDSLRAYQRYTQAYLQAPPGCAVLLSEKVRSVSGGLWIEKGMPEALWILECDKIGPFAVTMDCHGNSVYKKLQNNAKKMIDEMIRTE